MHIVIGALGSTVTILWLLHRLAEMGIDLGGLNPWAWRRRHKWRQAYEANPVYSVTSPMELTALLMAATAKADGDMSSEEKQAILGLFGREFHLSERDAASLLTASTHLLGRGEEVRDNLEQVMQPSRAKFSDAQARSAVAMIEEVAALGGGATQVQAELATRIRDGLMPPTAPTEEWT